ncbi:glycogen debranching N-terminal domain-containing protein [Streptomyces sp. NPDC017936]|uniref:glycogen debranching N-terminal domain-containing protein n=1 Tax=Streptomyces sp. NPDC017936 TaxID=3365016 RepID=UPI0037B3B20A
MADEVGAVIEETEPAVLTEATVTLVEGPTFCVSGASGDMEAEVPQGLFFRDMRVTTTTHSLTPPCTVVCRASPARLSSSYCTQAKSHTMTAPT